MKTVIIIAHAFVILSYAAVDSFKFRQNSESFCRPFQNAELTLLAPDTSGLVYPGSTVQLVSNQFSFTEGPAASKNGDIYFTDQPNDKIWIYKTTGELSLFMEKSGRSNGLYFDKKGNLVACADENNELWSFNRKGKKTVLVSSFEGKKLNGPNDVWVHPKRHIYFTDPYYQRSYWQRKSPEIKQQRVYHLPRGKQTVLVVDSTLVQPNGIIGSRDGRFLYVADIRANKTYRYRLSADGTVLNRDLFVEQGSDGMSIDEQGNIYLTGKGVMVYNSSGKKILQIDVPSKWTANVCFGGKENKTLFITASESVFTLQMLVKGAE